MNGLLYDLFTARAEKTLLGDLREELIAPLTGQIVEIGAGTGRNFPFYRAEAKVLALEPNRSMVRRAAPRAAAARAKIDLLIANDTHLESLEARGVDAVVLGLVMCSVDDPPCTLRRIHSVLKENGKLIVLEHVRSPIERVARVQNSIAPFWERITGDCRLNRDTGMELARAGFDISGLRLCRFSRFSPVQDLLIGAIAPSAARSPR